MNKEQSEMQEYYTVKRASEVLGLSEQVIRNYISQGKINAVKVLNTTAITSEEMNRQLNLRG